MRLGRTLPPAAAPLCWEDLCQGLAGIVSPDPSLRALEDEIRRHFGVRHVFLVSSGTAALTMTLMALRSSSRRTEIVIPAYTCFSVPAAVLRAGLRPVLCDIDPTTFDFDHAALDRALNGNTLCVVAHHLFGIATNIEQIRALCHARGIAVIEDAAQAMGVESNGRPLGTIGDVGIFSLGRGKHVTCGSGGIIVTNSDRMAHAIAEQWSRSEVPALLDILRDFVELVLLSVFIRPRLYWIPAALPFLRLGETVFPTEIPLKRLSGMHAGVLSHWRRRLIRSNHIRSAMAADLSRRLSHESAHGPSHPYLRLPILFATTEERARVYQRSRQQGLGISVAYPTPVNEIPELASTFAGQRFPSAQQVAERLLTIPTHEWLLEKDRRAIADCVGAQVHLSVATTHGVSCWTQSPTPSA
jgi:dTDP-4-amino-4,6-dideoxygalactose transaminase